MKLATIYPWELHFVDRSYRRADIDYPEDFKTLTPKYMKTMLDRGVNSVLVLAYPEVKQFWTRALAIIRLYKDTYGFYPHQEDACASHNT